MKRGENGQHRRIRVVQTVLDLEAGGLERVVADLVRRLDPQRFEAAITAAGLRIVQCIQLNGEARERSEEDGVATSSKQLLRVSRMLRNRAVYEERFGTLAYEYMLTDSLWGVYQMIGKLNPRIYVLSA